jgi:transglutaminase-like putative cysteine protease
LESRRGDCSESARLFVALCRGARIPARLVHGLLWTERGGGGFGLHAWAEVALADHWREVDPVSGDMPAHAVRLRLQDDATNLNALRNLGLEVESIERDQEPPK